VRTRARARGKKKALGIFRAQKGALRKKGVSYVTLGSVFQPALSHLLRNDGDSEKVILLKQFACIVITRSQVLVIEKTALIDCPDTSQ
jgi:hypothetical protein